MKFYKKYIKGVTLTELLVVVSVISFLVLFGLMFFRNQTQKGQDAKRKGDLHLIQVAVEEYEKDNNCYPPPELVVCDPGDGLKPYLNEIPCDPETGDSYLYENDGSTCSRWFRTYTALKADTNYSPGCDAGCGPAAAYNYYVESINAPQATPGPSGGSYYCAAIDNCSYFNNTVWDCTPNYFSTDCDGSCATETGACTRR